MSVKVRHRISLASPPATREGPIRSLGGRCAFVVEPRGGSCVDAGEGDSRIRQLLTRRTDMRIWLAGLTMWLAIVGTGLWLGATSGPAAAPAPKVYVGLFKDDAVAVMDPA